jgi:UDP-N-acetylmuramate dehydrogenase
VADAIRTQYPDVAAYPAGEGHVKLAAGWLIEKAGWKGFREEGYGVHKDQALVLVNHGGATGPNIFDLSTRILASIHERFGVELEREVNIL